MNSEKRSPCAKKCPTEICLYIIEDSFMYSFLNCLDNIEKNEITALITIISCDMYINKYIKNIDNIICIFSNYQRKYFKRSYKSEIKHVYIVFYLSLTEIYLPF